MDTIALLTQLYKFRNDAQLNAKKVQELSRQRFADLIVKTYHSSSFYRDLYSAHGVKPSDLRDVAPADLPIVDKSMIMDNFDAVVTIL